MSQPPTRVPSASATASRAWNRATASPRQAPSPQPSVRACGTPATADLARPGRLGMLPLLPCCSHPVEPSPQSLPPSQPQSTPPTPTKLQASQPRASHPATNAARQPAGQPTACGGISTLQSPASVAHRGSDPYRILSSQLGQAFSHSVQWTHRHITRFAAAQARTGLRLSPSISYGDKGIHHTAGDIPLACNTRPECSLQAGAWNAAGHDWARGPSKVRP